MARRKARLAKARGRRVATRDAERPATVAVPSALLRTLKREGPMTIRELAAGLDITYEAVRQQIGELVRAGWVTASRAPAPAGPAAGADACAPRPGPASRQYRLSAAAEHLFPKHYDELSVELLEHVLERFGGAGVVGILARMTEARVARWAPLLEGLSLRRKLEALSSLYEEKDAYMQVEWRAGAPALIERNCPFFSVAQKHPAICSVSVNTLEQLLGFKVLREQRFQAGHGRCVFRVRLDEPRRPGTSFALEQE
jgi:predicted ArsR family transcriptional regulator